MAGVIRYCLDCGWQIHDIEREDPSVAMIDHAIETGHNVESHERAADRSR
jgi:hypothetical protein